MSEPYDLLKRDVWMSLEKIYRNFDIRCCLITERVERKRAGALDFSKEFEKRDSTCKTHDFFHEV